MTNGHMDLVLVFHDVIYTASQPPFLEGCFLRLLLPVFCLWVGLVFLFLPFSLYRDSSGLDGLFFLLVSVR